MTAQQTWIGKRQCLAILAATAILAGCNKAPEPAVTERPSTETPVDKAPAEKAPSASASAPAETPAAASPGNEMTTTASGLKYQVLKRGTGTVSPKETDSVKVHYTGTLLNGTVFDSSVQRGEPISFPLKAVIPGWIEGLQLMKVGDKFKFEIPPALAYGENPPTPAIPPNSTLVFEVELLGIN